jgi:plasmid maintenance system antidote protein VapI
MENLRMGMIDAELRAAILGSKLTPYAIAKAADIAPGLITRFINGERDLRLGTAAKVAHALGLELRRARRSPRVKGC